MNDSTEPVEVVETAPAVRQEPASTQLQSTELQVMRELFVLSERICNTEFVPQGLRGKPDKVYAAVLSGRELGIGPMSSLKHVAVIDGRPNLSAAATLALIRNAGHKVSGEATSQMAEVTGRRADTDEEMTVTYTLDDALNGGLIDKVEGGKAIKRSQKGNPMPWELWTESMLWARAVTRLADRLFSDVLVGSFSRLPDEGIEVRNGD